MSRQKQFEGSDVRLLLDEIRGVYGGDPTIAKAETFRTGGLLGFFQRERYRLTVDAKGAPAAGERHAPSTTAPPRPAAPRTAAPGRAASSGADAFAVIAESTVDSNLVPTTSPPSRAPAHMAKKPRQPASAPPAPAPAQKPASSSPAKAGTHPVPFDAVLQRVASAVGAPAASAARAPATGTGTGTGTVAGSLGDDERRAASHAEDTARSGAEPPRALHASGEAPPGAGALETTPVGTVTRPRSMAGALSRAGLPRSLVDAVVRGVHDGAQPAAALVDVLGGIPPAPPLPRQRGSLIVVAGPAGAGVELARTLAGEVGSDPGDVLLASLRPPALLVPEGRRLQYADDAPAASAYRHRGVAVVAVDSSPGTTSASWADRMISSLHPTTVVALVDAVCKPDDVSAWLDAIGGVDCLAVENPEATVSPASILRLDVPVLRMGGHPASAARWAATILDRVLACE